MKKISRGFTLIELLVVIAIIAIIATIIIVNLALARVKSRDTRRVADLKQIQTAAEMYFDEENQSVYPGTENFGYRSDSATNWSNLAGWVDPTTSVKFSSFIPSLPKDPKNSGNYKYGYYWITPSGQSPSYYIVTKLEKNTDAMKNDGGINNPAIPAVNKDNCYELSNDFNYMNTRDAFQDICTL